MLNAWQYPNGPAKIMPPRDQANDPLFEVLDANELSINQTLSTQVLIVGSGAGGAVVAAELAKAGIEVIILEQGARFTRHDFHDSPLSAYIKMYENGGLTTTIGTPGIALPYGRAIGGTTIMNS